MRCIGLRKVGHFNLQSTARLHGDSLNVVRTGVLFSRWFFRVFLGFTVTCLKIMYATKQPFTDRTVRLKSPC